MTHPEVHVGMRQTVGDTNTQLTEQVSVHSHMLEGWAGTHVLPAHQREAEALKPVGGGSFLGLRDQLYPSAVGESLAVPPKGRRPPPFWGCPSLVFDRGPHTHPSRGGRTHSGSHCAVGSRDQKRSWTWQRRTGGMKHRQDSGETKAKLFITAIPQGFQGQL